MSDSIPPTRGTTPSDSGFQYVAFTGNPNCGKTTLFNALTGLRAKVGNYAGVTVERKEGRLIGASSPITLIDLPGAYSLLPKSLDEEVSRDVLLGHIPELPRPALVVVVVDASNLERNLYYATQVIELGYPCFLALNMVDVAEENGISLDLEALEHGLGVPVFPMVASTGQGLDEFKQDIDDFCSRGEWPKGEPKPGTAGRFCQVDSRATDAVHLLALALAEQGKIPTLRDQAQSILWLSSGVPQQRPKWMSAGIATKVTEARERLVQAGLDPQSLFIEARYASVGALAHAVVDHEQQLKETLSDRLDTVLTHRFWGILIFLGIMTLMFQGIFTLAEYPMAWIESAVGMLHQAVESAIPPGDLQDLLGNGVVEGVGAVVIFLPQISLLFLFIGLLEDTGYMARAAFLMDRLMSRVGLHGKSFIPMLSSFACAIPGIMATRTIENPKDRLATILVAPLMSCSARLPVYSILIAACIPSQRILGFLDLQGLTMLSMYLLGIVVALGMAWLLKKTILRGEPPLLIMELPPYKRPVALTVLKQVWDRSKLFLRRAGTVILGISILLWFMASYPRNAERETRYEQQTAAALEAGDEQKAQALASEHASLTLRDSFAGRVGRFIEPVISPLGFDWKIGIGLVASFAAREVFVSTMSTVYNVADYEGDDDASTTRLRDNLRAQQRPDGTKVYTPLIAVTLMVFYVFALQCVSTVAVVRRETNGWKWPIFQWAYMAVLAWGFAYATLSIGRLLGFS